MSTRLQMMSEEEVSERSELRRRLAFANATNLMAESIIASDDQREVLQSMACIVGDALKLDRTLIFDVDTQRGEVVETGAWVSPRVAGVAPPRGNFKLATFRSVFELIGRTRHAFESHASGPSDALVKDGADRLLHKEMGITSLYWQPFDFRKDGGFSIVAFNQVEHERRFNAAEREFIRVVAEYVSLALLKIRLRHEVAQASEELRESEARYRALSENAPSMFFTVDRAGNLVTANRTALEHMGYDARDLLSKPFSDIIHPDDRGHLRRQLEVCFAQRDGTVRFELRAQKKSGAVATIKARARCAPGLGGGDVAFLIFDDVTEQRRAEEALFQAQKLESIGLLAGGIAHDFNNLLVGVVGFADVALAELPEGSHTHAIVEQIMIAGRHAADLAAQLLAYAGRGQPRVEAVDVDALVTEMTELLRLSIPQDVELILDLDPQKPRVEGDRGQLRQVVMNLVVNAAEAVAAPAARTTAATGRIVVRTRSATREELAERFDRAALTEPRYVRLEVQDTGAGMDAETQARIFDPFFSTKRPGRGLGLAAVLGIVRAHRGAVRVTSAPGKGTALEVVLPYATAALRAPAARATAASSLSSLPTPLPPAASAVPRTSTPTPFAGLHGPTTPSFGVLPRTATPTGFASATTPSSPSSAFSPAASATPPAPAPVPAPGDVTPSAPFAALPRTPAPLPPLSPSLRRVLIVDDDAVVRLVAELMLRQLGIDAVAVADRDAAARIFDENTAAGPESTRIHCVLLDLAMPQGGGRAVLGDLRRKDPTLPVLIMSGYSEDEAATEADPHVVAFLRKPFTVEQLREGLSRVS